ncbi:MAG: glycosyltransferase family 39 protein [Anaerolineae bacterium]|nr:glycosyltransferase family 39 protein [Anaerolineae bacterium]
MRRRPFSTWWLPLTIVFLGFVLRVYLADNQSFAFDEGWTSYAIHHSWRDMWAVLAPDNHPPLYYVLVKAFADLAGYADFPVRFFSVIGGTVLIASVYTLGKRLGGLVAGLAAASFAACSPLLVYYAQEARMYSLLMALGVIASYCLLRMAADCPDTDRLHPTRWWLGYILATAGLLYTQYFGFLLVVAHNVAVLGWIVWTSARPKVLERTTRRLQLRAWGMSMAQKIRSWGAVQLAIVLFYAPWLPTAIHQVQVGQGTWWRIPLPPRMILTDIWLFFVLGPNRPVHVDKFGTLTSAVALAIFVALLLGWRKRIASWAFALISLVVPVALIVLAGSRLPIYTDRYTLVAAPGLALAVGFGVTACWNALAGQARRIAWVGRVAGLVLWISAIVAPWPQLDRYYHQPAYWREDFRRAAQYVMDTSDRGDAVIMLGCYQPMMQYYRGEAAVIRFPQQGDSVQGEREVVVALNQAISPDSQVRLVMYSWPTVDPQELVEGALRAQCRLQGEHWQQESGQRPIKVLNFEACAPFEVEPRQDANAVWDNQLTLSAYRLVHFKPGVQAHVFLWWQTLRPPDKNYNTFVHLLDAKGQMITQFDTLPLSDFYPMRAWPLHTEQRDDYPLNIPAGIDLDGAWLAVGVYDRTTMQRLPVIQDGVAVGDFIRIPVTR